MKLKDVDAVFFDETSDRLLGLAGVTAGEAAGGRQLTGDGNDAYREAGLTTDFFEAKGHVSRVEGGKTFQERFLP